MKLKDFIKNYDKNTDVSIIEKTMDVKYLPFVEKCNLCERIVNSTYYTTMPDKTKKFHVNSVSKYMLYRLSIIDKYTKIDIDFKDVLNEYDMLAKRNLFDVFETLVPEKELQELAMILELTEKDVITNEYEPHAFIANQAERFGTLVGVSLSPVLDTLAKSLGELDNDKLAAILSNLDKVDVKKVAKLLK